jgi:hypothetical protein
MSDIRPDILEMIKEEQKVSTQHLGDMSDIRPDILEMIKEEQKVSTQQLVTCPTSVQTS